MRTWQVWWTALEEPAQEVVAAHAEKAARIFARRHPGRSGEVTVAAGVLGRIYLVDGDRIVWVETVTGRAG